ncbi:NAD-dependent epimerase/dehydratase family protein [Natronosalvus rutilus]|uniref:NAD(P)-dependent oxidoreductase n=1 Tax=Natronosalvus rutilus TaxID=2953753 RepID=A0A9E7SW97_9EURY|nr:NAD(P)-dependent oxidoreductase [Natronosalvus rutilus]UTF54807.1 NAD(P)-dependent oxidoreductase [Natronosalvus rutilus]
MTDYPSIVVTGAAGYIGSRVVHQLQQTHPDWELTAIDNFYRGTIREIGETTIEHVDVRDRERLYEVLEGADIVMHLAAISGVDDCERHSKLTHDVNVQATTDIAWFCREHGTGLIFPASMALVGDPVEFPITTDHPRDPLNWYGRSKYLGEQVIETLATDAFPAHLYLKSNLYGEHRIGERVVSKGTVINFFVNRALAGEPLTVYEPGTQSRNFVHVKDVARVYVRSAEVLVQQLEAGETGLSKYAVGTDEDPSVHEMAELVAAIAGEETGREPPIELVENPRTGETLVSNFSIETTRTSEDLGWEVKHSVEESIRELLQQKSS